VAQVTPERDRVPVLPKGAWQKLELVGEGAHPDLPALYLRPGAILPIGPVIQYVDQPAPKPDGDRAIGAGEHPLTLLVALDADGRASGTLYEDAGDGFGFERGQYLRTTYQAVTEGARVKFEIVHKEGSFQRPPRELRIMLLKDGWYYPGSGVDGQAITIDTAKVSPVRPGT
jgi:alpha-glucosidase (family GH31 glycosyl hydrolase)